MLRSRFPARWLGPTAVLAGLGLAPAAGAQQTVQTGFRVSSTVSLRITVPAGTITISGWDRDSVAVSGTVPPGGGSWYGGGAGGAAKMGVEGNDNATGPGATLRIMVPRQARVWIKTVTASVEAAELAGELDVLSVSGGITVRSAPGAVRLESLEGAIRVSGDSAVARLRTGSGTITADLRAGDLTAISVSGEVSLGARRLDRARVETVGGAVAVTGALAPHGSLLVETHGGNVTLGLTRPVNAGFELSSVSGAVSVELGGKPMRSTGRPLEFSTGTATAQVTIRSFKGTITLRHLPD